ncbi:MAG: TIGR02301 family protein, partial [Bosea sp. (in: a-proteobacteria)]
QQPAPSQAPAPEPPPEPLPPYNTDLMKLSEVMGAIAFLRTLCTGADEAIWRDRMAMLIESEARTPPRREALAGAYNQGFRGYALTYRSCTESAQEALVRLARDGDRLSRALSGRFGG